MVRPPYPDGLAGGQAAVAGRPGRRAGPRRRPTWRAAATGPARPPTEPAHRPPSGTVASSGRKRPGPGTVGLTQKLSGPGPGPVSLSEVRRTARGRGPLPREVRPVRPHADVRDIRRVWQ